MAKVGVNNEPLHERLIFAYDGSDYRVVKCDTDGNLVAALDTSQNVQARTYGYYDDGWIEQPLQPGITSGAAVEASDDSADAGTNTLALGTVPTGKLWRVQLIIGRDRDNAPSSILCRATLGGTSVVVYADYSPGVDQWVIWTGEIILFEGDDFDVRMTGVTAGDRIGAQGYYIEMDVA